MFDWLSDALDWVGDKITGVGTAISEAVWDVFLKWIFQTIYDAAAEFFGMINNMGSEIFDLEWTASFLKLFSLFGWSLFAAGIVVAVFDTAIEYQNGRANIQGTCLNVLKGFMAVSLFTRLPVELYRFCITLQTSFSKSIVGAFTDNVHSDLGATAKVVLKNMGGYSGLIGLLTLIAFAYCVVKLFFANIKRGGILLCQIAVGSLYMFSVPRGYSDGFNGWCKQVFAICLTAFLQTSLMFLGMITWQTNTLLGLGIILAANEVPRIAQQFGLDTSVKVNMMSVSHTVSSAVSTGKLVAKALR